MEVSMQNIDKLVKLAKQNVEELNKRAFMPPPDPSQQAAQAPGMAQLPAAGPTPAEAGADASQGAGAAPEPMPAGGGEMPPEAGGGEELTVEQRLENVEMMLLQMMEMMGLAPGMGGAGGAGGAAPAPGAGVMPTNEGGPPTPEAMMPEAAPMPPMGEPKIAAALNFISKMKQS
jgi:hypothetical protein